MTDCNKDCKIADRKLGTGPPRLSQQNGEVIEHIDWLEQLDEKVDLMIALSVNFSPDTKLNKLCSSVYLHKKKIVNDTWGRLLPAQQREVFDHIIESKILPTGDMMEVRYELTKKGELHCHCALIMKNQKKHAFYNLSVFRKDLNARFRIGDKVAIRMFHSFAVDDWKKWIEYIRKDCDLIPLKPHYYNINYFMK